MTKSEKTRFDDLAAEMADALTVLWWKTPRRTRNRMIHQPADYRSLDKWKYKAMLKISESNTNRSHFDLLWNAHNYNRKFIWEPPTGSFTP